MGVNNSDTDLLSLGSRQYDLRILDTRPGPAINIIECDLNVNLLPPIKVIITG